MGVDTGSAFDESRLNAARVECRTSENDSPSQPDVVKELAFGFVASWR
jgi:hypothetical protein